MRVVLIRAAVFAVIFFVAGLIMERGRLWRVLLATLLATAVYLVLHSLFARLGPGVKK